MRTTQRRIAKIKGRDIYAIDIAKLYDEEQTFVFGDLIHITYSLKSEGEDIPEKIIFFVDESNNYASSSRQTSPILD